MYELRIVNYAAIHLIFLLWKEVQSLAIQKSFLISFFAKRKSDVVNFTMPDLDQGQCPSTLS